MSSPDAPRRASWSVAWFAFTTVFALLGTTALVLPRLAPMAVPRPVAASRPSRHVFACASTEPADAHPDQGFCHRLQADLTSRTIITTADRDQLLPQTRAIDEVLIHLTPAPATAASATAMQAALVAAGYAEAAARVARPGDPAPHHSIIFAVPLGDACYLGHRAGLGGAGLSLLVGQLPTGLCLES